DHLDLGEVAADVVEAGGKFYVTPQIAVADDRAGATGVDAGADAGGGDGVADHQSVGEAHLWVRDLGNEGVDAQAAPVGGVCVAGGDGFPGQGIADDGVVGQLDGRLEDVDAAAELEG